MDSDNPYFQKPGVVDVAETPEAKKARDDEKAKVEAEVPIMEAVVKHFEERIAECGLIKSAQVDLAEDPALHQKTCHALEILSGFLEQEKSTLESLLADYKR